MNDFGPLYWDLDLVDHIAAGVAAGAVVDAGVAGDRIGDWVQATRYWESTWWANVSVVGRW